MRSQWHPKSVRPRVVPFVDILAQALCAVSTVFLLLGDLVAARTHPVKETDRSEPPDAAFGLAPA